MREEIYSSQLHAGSRKYFFDVKKASTDKLYLDLTESRKKADGTYERHNIMVFEEDFKHFKNEIVELYDKFFSTVNLHTHKEE
ncbi:MAG: DUF3276 family protein [Candidatus Kapabacteria bacterium]|nr:DUF3276 family protein [Candidatus Kapabacteria bacterium]